MPPVHLAGYDGTPAARAAVDLAIALGRPVGARVICVTGYDIPFPSLGKGGALAADALLAEEARHGASAVAAEVHAPGVERITQPGGGAAGLRVVADAEHADLIVVGVSDRRRFGRLVPGTTAERLIHGAPCAVAVAPASFRDGPLGTIAVAYDRGAEARVAFETARDLAVLHGARLRILSACPATSPASGPTRPASTPYQELLRSELDALLTTLPHDLEATADIVYGLAGQALLDACGEDVDLLVTGSRAYGPLRGALVGSTSRHLVDHARCPVLVVPRSVTSPVTHADARMATS